LGPRRAVVCLNGLWRFQPALGPAVASPQSTGWGWVRVPGSWRAWGAFEGVTRASGPSWDGFDGENPAAWYERDLTVPAPWSGRAIFLDLQRVSTDAAVFIDGREVGRLAWPGGEIDLTAAVQPGQTHRLRLKVWQPRADGLVLCRLARQRVQLRRAVAVGPGRAGPAGVR
jgi:beta-galactosidase